MKFFKSRIWKAYRFPLLLFMSVVTGCIIGVVFKKDATNIKPLGDIFLNLMYTIVTPLVFFTISSSIANMVNKKRLGKILKWIGIIFVITSAISAILMLVSTILINPVGNVTIPLEKNVTMETLAIKDQIVSAITVSNFYELFSRSNMLPLIIFSILFGISVNFTGRKKGAVTEFLISMSSVMMKLVHIIMYYAPIGLCAYFAALIGEFGPNLIGSYAKSMVLYYGLCIVYFIVFYSIYTYIAAGKKGIKTFFSKCFNVVATSLATQSSLASLPTNLETAKDVNVPKDIREVTLPVGSTMHMEGSAMAAILKIVFLFSIFDKSFTGLDNYLIAIIIAVLSAVVMSGIPGGGLIGEMLIINLYGLPLSAFPIIATIGFLVDPPATCLNVTGDTVSSMLVTRVVDGKDWINKRKEKI